MVSADEAAELLSLALDLPLDALKEARRGVTPEWDSLHHVELMFLVEERTGVLLEPEQLAEIIDLPSLIRVMSSLST